MFEECPADDEIAAIDLKGIEEASLSHLITDLTAKIEKEDGESTAPSAACTSKPLALIDNRILDSSSISVTPLPNSN